MESNETNRLNTGLEIVERKQHEQAGALDAVERRQRAETARLDEYETRLKAVETR
jgi:hypothetical protein